MDYCPYCQQVPDLCNCDGGCPGPEISYAQYQSGDFRDRFLDEKPIVNECSEPDCALCELIKIREDLKNTHCDQCHNSLPCECLPF